MQKSRSRSLPKKKKKKSKVLILNRVFAICIVIDCFKLSPKCRTKHLETFAPLVNQKVPSAPVKCKMSLPSRHIRWTLFHRRFTQKPKDLFFSRTAKRENAIKEGDRLGGGAQTSLSWIWIYLLYSTLLTTAVNQLISTGLRVNMKDCN